MPKVQEHLHDAKPYEKKKKRKKKTPKTLAVMDLSLADVMQLFGLTYKIIPPQTVWNTPPLEMMDLPDSMGKSSLFFIHQA